jgi:hypothetical protein
MVGGREGDSKSLSHARKADRISSHSGWTRAPANRRSAGRVGSALGARWAFGPPRSSELDPIILLWWIRRRVTVSRISRPRVVIQFDFRGAPQRSYWLLIQLGDVSVCLKHPGFDVDAIVAAHIMMFYQVWLGRL